MNTLKKTKPQPKTPLKAPVEAKAGKKKKEVRAEQSLGIRIVALTMNLLLILASASYIPTLPLTTFLFSMTAILGSYLAYIYRDNRPAWVGTIPTVATMVLFTNFFFEIFTGYSSGSATAVGAFIHMLTGLLALHCFDLRSRTDFSISALIGLGLLTCLAGMAKDMVYGFYIFTYTVLAGLLLFYDSSSRSHEIGPSRAVTAAPAAGAAPGGGGGGKDAGLRPDLVVKRLRVASMAALIPVFVLPFLSVLAFNAIPRIDSVIDLFKDNFVRAKFPVSANLSGQLGKGGQSQSIRGGAPQTKPQGGASYTVKGGEDGTASGAQTSKQNNDPNGEGHGPPGTISSGNGGKGGKHGTPGLGSGKPQNAEAARQAAREKALNDAYEKETVDLKGVASQLDEIVLKVASPQATYIRRYSLNNFDGTTWTRSLPVNTMGINKSGSDKLGYDLTASDAVYVPPNLPTLEVKQDFRVEKDNIFGHILPHSWIPQLVKIKGEVSGDAKKIQVSQEIKIDGDGAIKLAQPLIQGSSFSVTSQIPVYDFDQMRNLAPETVEQVGEEREDEIKLAKSCLNHPGAPTSDKVDQLAREITGTDGNWFFKADRIANYLRKNYKYDNSSFGKETAPTEADGNTSTPVEDFLFVKKQGDCRLFATAFALLCRSQGIPTRLVTGFTPGELNKSTGFYEIKGKNSHVWAEIYLPYWNWVPFDATPGGQLPAHEEGGNALSRFIKSGLANPFGQNYAASRRGKKDANRDNQHHDGKDKDDKEGKKNDFWNFGIDKNKNQKMQLPIVGPVDQGTVQQVLKYTVVTVAILILLLILFLYLKQRKESQLKDFMQTHKPSTLVFLDVLTELKRYELLKYPTETADEISLRLNDRFAELEKTGIYIPEQLPGVVSQFMQIYCEDRFGGDDRLEELTMMSAHIKKLAHSKGRK